MTGHELAGEVFALGPDVAGLEIGQRVGVEPRHLISCGRCRWCRRGDVQLCPSLGVLRDRQVRSTGFAEFSLESADKCWPLPDGIVVEDATLLDVFAVAVHAVHRVPVEPTDTVVVLGAGPIGLAISQVARELGAGQVITAGTRDEPLTLARQLGCDATINVTEQDLVASINALTHGEGADIVYEAVGGNAPTLAQAVSVCARGGRIGITGSFLKPQTLDASMAMRKELTVNWVWSYGMWRGVPEYKVALDLLSRGRLQASPLITHRFPLDRISEAFAAADNKHESGAVKVLVVPE
jgi:threonine dehydrogenase-like Zn-dependent dehydrogenase